MPDIEFFFDPVCPWAWITSRLAVEVASQRELDIRWRFISLQFVNEHLYAEDAKAVAEGREPDRPPTYREATEFTLGLLRIAAAIDASLGNEAVGRFYTACGEIIHTSGRGLPVASSGNDFDLIGEALAAAELDDALRSNFDNDSWDEQLRADAETALGRTGRDVGTPIITFDLERPDEASLFGPVISRIPRGEEALRLWDAVETIARTPGIAEFKRSLRSEPTFT
ncbi:MAG: DsbA family protein [Microthrixaceae bacterium]